MGFAELIKKMKAQGKGLMSMGQYMAVGHVVDALSPCNFLVFGLGEDASVWDDINVGGRTVFLEDDVDWIRRATREAEAAAAKAGIRGWHEQHLRAKWRWTGHMARMAFYRPCSWTLKTTCC